MNEGRASPGRSKPPAVRAAVHATPKAPAPTPTTADHSGPGGIVAAAGGLTPVPPVNPTCGAGGVVAATGVRPVRPVNPRDEGSAAASSIACGAYSVEVSSRTAVVHDVSLNDDMPVVDAGGANAFGEKDGPLPERKTDGSTVRGGGVAAVEQATGRVGLGVTARGGITPVGQTTGGVAHARGEVGENVHLIAEGSAPATGASSAGTTANGNSQPQPPAAPLINRQDECFVTASQKQPLPTPAPSTKRHDGRVVPVSTSAVESSIDVVGGVRRGAHGTDLSNRAQTCLGVSVVDDEKVIVVSSGEGGPTAARRLGEMETGPGSCTETSATVMVSTESNVDPTTTDWVATGQPPLRNGQSFVAAAEPPVHNGRSLVSTGQAPVHNGRNIDSTGQAPVHNGRSLRDTVAKIGADCEDPTGSDRQSGRNLANASTDGGTDRQGLAGKDRQSRLCAEIGLCPPWSASTVGDRSSHGLHSGPASASSVQDISSHGSHGRNDRCAALDRLAMLATAQDRPSHALHDKDGGSAALDGLAAALTVQDRSSYPHGGPAGVDGAPAASVRGPNHVSKTSSTSTTPPKTSLAVPTESTPAELNADGNTVRSTGQSDSSNVGTVEERDSKKAVAVQAIPSREPNTPPRKPNILSRESNETVAVQGIPSRVSQPPGPAPHEGAGEESKLNKTVEMQDTSSGVLQSLDNVGSASCRNSGRTGHPVTETVLAIAGGDGSGSGDGKEVAVHGAPSGVLQSPNDAGSALNKDSGRGGHPVTVTNSAITGGSGSDDKEAAAPAGSVTETLNQDRQSPTAFEGIGASGAVGVGAVAGTPRGEGDLPTAFDPRGDSSAVGNTVAGGNMTASSPREGQFPTASEGRGGSNAVGNMAAVGVTTGTPSPHQERQPLSASEGRGGSSAVGNTIAVDAMTETTPRARELPPTSETRDGSNSVKTVWVPDVGVVAVTNRGGSPSSETNRSGIPPDVTMVHVDLDPTAAAGSGGTPGPALSGWQRFAAARASVTAHRESADKEKAAAIAGSGSRGQQYAVKRDSGAARRGGFEQEAPAAFARAPPIALPSPTAAPGNGTPSSAISERQLSTKARDDDGTARREGTNKEATAAISRAPLAGLPCLGEHGTAAAQNVIGSTGVPAQAGVDRGAGARAAAAVAQAAMGRGEGASTAAAPATPCASVVAERPPHGSGSRRDSTIEFGTSGAPARAVDERGEGSTATAVARAMVGRGEGASAATAVATPSGVGSTASRTGSDSRSDTAGEKGGTTIPHCGAITIYSR